MDGAEIVGTPVVTDGNIITAKGPGAAAQFGFEIGALLKDRVSSDFERKTMQY